MRNHMKRALLFLSVIIVVFLTACGTTNNMDGTVNNEIEKVVVPYMLTMNAAEELPLVQEEVNKITRRKINVEVELIPIDFASWNNQLNLLLINGSVDLFNCCYMPSLSSYVNSGAVAPLDDLLKEYGSGITEIIGCLLYTSPSPRD